MVWTDLDKLEEEPEYEEHFSRFCVKHRRFYEGQCPIGPHRVRIWWVVNLRTMVAMILCRDNFGPIKFIRRKVREDE